MSKIYDALTHAPRDDTETCEYTDTTDIETRYTYTRAMSKRHDRHIKRHVNIQTRQTRDTVHTHKRHVEETR